MNALVLMAVLPQQLPTQLVFSHWLSRLGVSICPLEFTPAIDYSLNYF